MKFFETIKTGWNWLINHRFTAGVLVGMIFVSAIIICILAAVR